MRIIFAGTPDFAAHHLTALLDSPHDVVCIYTQPDRPAGRGRKLRPSPVKALALEQGIAVRQPDSLRDPQAVSALTHLQADLMIVVAYGLLLPPEVLRAPRLGCINVHASLLPRWRGAAPIQRAILAGDEKTGAAIMQMDKGLDTGPVWHMAETDIRAGDTAGSLHDRLAVLGRRALLESLPTIEAGRQQPWPQDEAGITYAHKLSKAEARLDWQRPATELARQVRGFNPWPVAHTVWQRQPFKIWATEAIAAKAEASPGTIVDSSRDGIVIACGEGLLRLLEVQRAGGRRQAVSDFLNAHPLTAGEVLGQ